MERSNDRSASQAIRLALLAITTIGIPTLTAIAQDTPAANPAPLTTSHPLLSDDALPAPLESQQLINFARALELVSGQNPQVAFANQQIGEAYAQLTGARALWLPSIRAGVFYNKHEGPLQANDGSVDSNSRSALEAGLGMNAVGGGSPSVPGLLANFRMSDAVFQPRIAGEALTARRFAATATTHDALLEAAIAYLDLLRAYEQSAIAAETLAHAQQLGDLTGAFARSGQGSEADADRAQTELSLRKNVAAQSDASIRIAAARLAQLLNLPPDPPLVPEELTLAPIDLISTEPSVAELIAEGLSRRPELSESRALVTEAVDRLRRERFAPLLPSVILGISQGTYGGGPGATLTDFDGRFDLDATAYWELRNFGFGEAAARQGARSRVEQARILEVQVMDQVAREIVEAQTRVVSLRSQLAVAQSAISVANDSYRRNLDRIRGGQGLPLEVLQSMQALDLSRREYLRVVGDYDEWQFRLYRALGCPIPGSVSPTK